MTVSSNVYAEKVFAEHPVAMWLLDDTADYVSLITEAERDITQSFWTKTNITSTSISTVSGIDSPFPSSYTTKITGTKPTSGTHFIKVESGVIDDLGDLKIDLKTFNFSTYIYSSLSSQVVEEVSIGYSYYSSLTSTWVDVEQNFTNFPQQEWTLVSSTFEIQEYNDFKIYIKFKVNSTSASSYDFYINGMTVGQWSEEFCATSLGVQPINLPSTINLPASLATIAYSYGLEENNGYYLINKKFLTAKNTGIPLVFGASNITLITENVDSLNNPIPSLILPGKGFLNKIGQYQEYTVEFWARINCDSPDPLRIFGPIKSNDGIYVEDGFITLSIGGVSGSHFVGEWYRPMLIHIIITRDSAKLLINGEEVVQLSIVTSSLTFPSQYSLDNKSQDWVGFYGYENVYPFEIDNVSISSYQIPTLVAKRRYLYGQAVGSPENINTAFGGTTAFIDYSFSNYSVNYNYPDFAKWQQGSIENLTTTARSLETPDYQLPDIYTGNFSLSTFYTENQKIQDPLETNKFITFRPNLYDSSLSEPITDDWNSAQTYINFSKLNFLTSPVAGFYGVFQTQGTNDQILFKLYNRITGDSLTMKRDRHPVVSGGPDVDVIAFYLNFGGTESNNFIVKQYNPSDKVAVGIDIQKFSEYYGGNVASFFGNINGLELFVAGDGSLSEVFTGKIYDVGICTKRNLSELSNHFDIDGTALVADATKLLSHLASYTLVVAENYGVLGLDVGVSGYWQDYVPLSYFAKYVKDNEGNNYYDLDLLQFNLAYPANSLLVSSTTSTPWTYADILTSTNYSTYGQLFNYALNNSLNYQEFSSNQTTVFSFNTSNSSVKSYVTFQYVEDGANLIPSTFTELTSANESKIIDISNYSDWEKRKFEVVDNNIIYPRKDVDFNDVAVVVSLEFASRGILNKKISINHLHLASLALNDNSSNPIGTRFGVNIYPYKQSDLYFTYKEKNPISIYKGSTPYLYLNRYSGIEIRGSVDNLETRGVAIPMNEKSAAPYSVNAFQLWMRYDEDQFPKGITQLFEIVGKNETIKFYLEPTDVGRQRGKIFALTNNASDQFLSLSYYVNGNPVLLPTVTAKQWISLGISLDTSMNLDNYSGSINLNGPFVFNNISYYKTNNLANIETVVTRQWLAVREIPKDSDPSTDAGWEYWRDEINPDTNLKWTWRNVYGTFSSTELGLNPRDIYQSYIGTNKIVVDDNFGLLVASDKTLAHNGVLWNRRYEIPV